MLGLMVRFTLLETEAQLKMMAKHWRLNREGKAWFLPGKDLSTRPRMQLGDSKPCARDVRIFLIIFQFVEVAPIS